MAAVDFHLQELGSLQHFHCCPGDTLLTNPNANYEHYLQQRTHDEPLIHPLHAPHQGDTIQRQGCCRGHVPRPRVLKHVAATRVVHYLAIEGILDAG